MIKKRINNNIKNKHFSNNMQVKIGHYNNYQIKPQKKNKKIIREYINFLNYKKI